jgi:hypothetical protein
MIAKNSFTLAAIQKPADFCEPRLEFLQLRRL